MPLVFIELKNSNVKLQERLRRQPDELQDGDSAALPHQRLLRAFQRHRDQGRQHHGASGSISSTGCAWTTRRRRSTARRSARRAPAWSGVIAGLLPPATAARLRRELHPLLQGDQKIIAQNHQFIGVNRPSTVPEARVNWHGKLGVFWHTQGSGKSFSMIFYARKIFRKLHGQLHLCGGDRPRRSGRADLPQLPHTDTVSKAEAAQPKDSEEMREFLGQNKRAGLHAHPEIPLRTRARSIRCSPTRDDIIVIVDEAHRTQYKSPGREHARGPAQRAISRLYRHAAAGPRAQDQCLVRRLRFANTTSSSPWTTAQRCRSFTRSACRRC